MRFHNCAWVCQADGTGSVDGGRPKGLPYPIPEKFLRTVGAAISRPQAFPRGGRWLAEGQADEGGLRNGRGPSAGRPVSGPYEKEGTTSRFAVGAAHRAARERADEDIGLYKNAAALVSTVPLSHT